MDEPVVEMVAGLPRPALRPLVAGWAGYRIEGQAPGIHRGLPSRHLTVIVTLDSTVDLAAMPDPAQPPASFTTLAGGLHAAPVLISHNGYQHGIQLALTPLGSRALLGVPAGELAGTVLDLRALLGPLAEELVERLRATRTWQERFGVLDTALAGVASSPPRGPSPELTWAWRQLVRTRGQAGVAGLAGEIGWSRRHLSERFRREFGLTPKVAGRVMRFEAAQRLLRTPAPPSLADIAARCGYYDQAHLYREWRELAGCTPTRWRADEVTASSAPPGELAGEFPSVHDKGPRAETCSVA